jgi:hypothetical protein
LIKKKFYAKKIQFSLCFCAAKCVSISAEMTVADSSNLSLQQGHFAATYL